MSQNRDQDEEKIRFWVFVIFSAVLYCCISIKLVWKCYCNILSTLRDMAISYISLTINLAFVFNWIFILFLGLLRSPYFFRKFILQTDASGTGLGAVLEQEFEEGRHPIMSISKKLSGAECNYAVVEKECFAIIWAVKLWRIFLEGKEFTVFTDHALLQWL